MHHIDKQYCCIFIEYARSEIRTCINTLIFKCVYIRLLLHIIFHQTSELTLDGNTISILENGILNS